MWAVLGNTLTMVEGDFGITLPITVNGATFEALDNLKITFKTSQNGETILTKDYTNITQNTINLELTEAESALFPVGAYVYSLDWYQNGVFLCNVIPTAILKVVGKA